MALSIDLKHNFPLVSEKRMNLEEMIAREIRNVNGCHPKPMDTCLSQLMEGFFNTGLYRDANNFIRMTDPNLYRIHVQFVI